jgi:diguanylate cyclase (GGDEF)-like protein
LKGLLFKSVTVFFSIALITFYLSYLYTNYNQKIDIENELQQIKRQGNQALNILLQQRVEQLTSFAEEISLLKENSTEKTSDDFEHLKDIWAKIKINRSLTSLYLDSEKKLLLGKALPEFLTLQALKAKQELQPFHQIYCGLSCEITISIPVYINGKTASLSLTSELLPAIIYASESLGLDIGLINRTKLFRRNGISKEYPFEILTNIKDNALIISQIAEQKKELTTLQKGYLHRNKIANKYVYLWGEMIGEKGSEATFIFLKDLTLTMHKYETQKKSILFHSAVISFGIIIVIVMLVFFPLKKLRLLTEVIEDIGAKNYSKAKNILAELKNSHSKDELSTLSFAMDEALYRIEGYEKKIISNQKAFKQQATVDSLTQLLNRNAFIQNLTELQNSTEHNEIALALLDLDGFKPINDNLGHEAGDEVLKQVGRRLNKMANEKVTAYRLGGDEFVVSIEDKFNRENIYNQLVSLFNDNFTISGTKIKITASVGIAIGDLTSSSHSELLRQADIAMYEAKKLGKNRYCVFEATMMEYSNLRFTITNDFMSALNNGEIFLKFQPIIDAKTKSIMKLEALSRWEHSQVGFIRPDIFISVVEGTAYIQDLGYWLIRQCILQLVDLRGNGFENIIISINISAAQISDVSSITFIQNECDKRQVPYHLIELEITETSLISNFKAAKNWILEAQKVGFKVSIDDFGTGYSSLSYLTLFPFNTVKLDRSLINHIPEDLNQKKIAKSIIRMLKDLEVDVVVEGVENKAQFNVIKQLGADMIQGYYFSRPLNKESLNKVFDEYQANQLIFVPSKS